MTTQQRLSGILHHPSSFAGPHGIGDLGASARGFVDFLQGAEQSLWQVLPLGPVGTDGCPYSSSSAFAGNPLLISLEELVCQGLLYPHELELLPPLNEGVVDWQTAWHRKQPLLDAAFTRLPASELQRYVSYCKQHAYWLDDYALFACLTERYASPWQSWPKAIRQRQRAVLDELQHECAEQLNRHKFYQYLFDQQWLALRDYANRKGIRIVGDAPIYVGLNSADVWANPELFQLDSNGNPKIVAAAAPDRFFDEMGQRWGNPVYHWAAHAKDNFHWWRMRLTRQWQLCDVVRLDHFRGIEAYWALPCKELDARKGLWLKGPGQAFFNALKAHFPDLPMIVEDLGYITSSVEQLRDRNNLAGMAVLQFAFGSKESDNPYYPHLLKKNSVVYTGTHDTNTSKAWIDELTPSQRATLYSYPGVDIRLSTEQQLLHLAWHSRARWAIAPLQDILGLGETARMNTPGKQLLSNWGWRELPKQRQLKHQTELKQLTRRCQRSLTQQVHLQSAGLAQPA